MLIFQDFSAIVTSKIAILKSRDTSKIDPENWVSSFLYAVVTDDC